MIVLMEPSWRPDRREAVERFRGGFEAVEDAVAGTTDADLDRAPATGDGWTARMVVHHLADSEATAYVRLRKLIAEEDAQIQGYDEERFAERLHYERPIAASLGCCAPCGRPAWSCSNH